MSSKEPFNLAEGIKNVINSFKPNSTSNEYSNENNILNETQLHQSHIDLNSFIELFKNTYYKNNDERFNPNANNKEANKLLYTIMYWLFKEEESFLKSPLLNKNINNPSIKKSLCIVGGVGCGKTTTIETFMDICRKANDQFIQLKVPSFEDKEIMIPLNRFIPNFRSFNANKVVELYEGCITQNDKTNFWRTMTKGNIYFDDVLTERQASNYGKVELFKDIFEKRYENKSGITILSLNYCKLYDQTNKLYDVKTKQGGGNLKDTLDVIYSKYGMRVEDRFYKSFNFIELSGSSLRK